MLSPLVPLALPSGNIRSRDHADYSTLTIESEIVDVQVLLDQTNEEMVYEEGCIEFATGICVKNVELISNRTCPISPSLPGASSSSISSIGSSMTFLPTFGVFAFVVLLVRFLQTPISAKCALHTSGFVSSGED